MLVGIIFIGSSPFMKQFGLENYPIFVQIAGVFFLCYGFLLVVSSRAVERYMIVPLLNILLRVIMIFLILMNFSIFNDFIRIFIPAIIYDGIWSILVLLGLKKLYLVHLPK
ncbi:MAG: hypothetical protein ACFE8N_13970 [Promethearchaeota archaeon]